MNLIKESLMDDSHVSSTRIQAYIALATVYGVWAITNLTTLCVVAFGPQILTEFKLSGWVEIISLTGALLVGKGIQNFAEVKKV